MLRALRVNPRSTAEVGHTKEDARPFLSAGRHVSGEFLGPNTWKTAVILAIMYDWDVREAQVMALALRDMKASDPDKYNRTVANIRKDVEAPEAQQAYEEWARSAPWTPSL